MGIRNIEEVLKSQEYNFLREDKNLGNNIILLGYGGSYAYGTNNKNSDIDIRGVATRSKRDILIGSDFEQVVDVETDTTVYSFDKIIKLLCSCNPNVIELLGLKPEHYVYLADAGKKLIDNRHLFLSKKAIYSFGGYTHAQLKRLENKTTRFASQTKQESHILKTIKYAWIDLKSKVADFPDDCIKLYVDKSNRENHDSEIFCDISLKHYPLRDYKGIINEMNTIIKSYSKIGHRNTNAIKHEKLEKHMLHLVRLYLMCFDILEKEEIITYREKEHDLLMSIRNGEFLDVNNQPTNEFYELVNELEKRFEYAKMNTSLPDDVNINLISDFVESINWGVVNYG